MAHAGEAVIRSTEFQDDSERPEVSPALAEVAMWLLESPNNPTYADSPTYKRFKAWLDTHEAAIDEQFQQGVHSMRYDHVHTDLGHIAEFLEQPDMYRAQTIAYAGELGSAAEAFRQTTPEDGVDDMNQRAVDVISGTLLRSRYFELLSANTPAVHDRFGDRPFITTYRQNILATIQLAARLEHEAQELAQPTDLRLAA